MASGKKRYGNKPVLVRCIWHEDKAPSLAVYRDSAFCYGCRKRVSVLEWIALQERLDIGEDFRKVLEIANKQYAGGVSVTPRVIEKAELKAWEPMNPAHALFCHERLGAKRQFFRDRGIADWLIDEEKFGYDVKAFTIPIWSAAGELLTIRYRRDDAFGTDGSKYWGVGGRNNVVLVNEKALSKESLAMSKGVVVLCEGELKSFRLWSEKIAAVSVTNGANAIDEAFVPMFDMADVVVVAHDMDEEGLESGEPVARLFGSRGRIMMWPKELGKGVDDLMQTVGAEKVRELIATAKPPKKIDAYWGARLKGDFWDDRRGTKK